MEQNNTPVTVEKCGIILHSEIPGLGASPDGKVYDTVCNKFGGLEVKCPISKAGMTIEQGFYLANDNGNIHLKISHDYFYQVQGQMFISGLEWTDFVVWLGKEIFIERVKFDFDLWHSRSMRN
ncbi:hypothetical protein SNE40_001615 [Patella caerulea]|uniref:YqaJ viral recombinase domain-containing protein n=1 Tax=Patella caerulea TaxID=87958 RepID=A0AAN8Q8C0_PATCE